MTHTIPDATRPQDNTRSNVEKVMQEDVARHLGVPLQVLREYELMGKDPYEWLHYANALKQVVDILKREIENADSAHPTWRVFGLSYSYYLLAGLSLENLFKGILIGRDKSLVSQGQMSSKLQGHGLRKLANKVVSSIEMSLLQNEQNLLEKLQDRIVNGKYPIPLNVKNYNPTDLIPSDFWIIDGMFEKFSAVLKNETAHPSSFRVE